MDDDGDDKDDTKRRTRNLSEKKRRDQFNMLVNELSSMVSTNNRKMDKSTVLKTTISFLKNHNDITVRSRAHDVQEDWKPSFLSNEEFTYLVLEALEGFLIVFSASGWIHYVSDSVTSLLAHNPVDLVTQSIFDLVHEDDRPQLYGLLQSVTPMHIGQNNDNEVKFRLHVKRGILDFRDETSYELVQFNGYFRTHTENDNCDERLSYEQQDHKSRLVFVCSGRLQTPHLIRDVSLVDSSRNEFTSRHSLEWKFLFLDHRASPIIGYLPFEVLGTSGYDYYHFDDLEKVVSCHEALMQKGELTSCFYRFLTKGQQWIWLQTRYYITYHQWNSKPEFVVCTHRVVSYSDITHNLKQEARDDTPSEADTRAATSNAPPHDGTISPSCLSEASDLYGTSSYVHTSQTASVNSASAPSTAGTAGTAGTGGTGVTGHGPLMNFGHYQTRGTVSDTGSASGDDRSERRTCDRDSCHTEELMTVIPHHVIGAQYLEPVPYVRAVSVAGVMSVPVIATTDQAEEQLQRKHEELQQMIVRQQAELRQVRKQLLLARLGILPPMINVNSPYLMDQDIQQAQNMSPQILYEAVQPRPPETDYPQNPPHPHMPQ